MSNKYIDLTDKIVNELSFHRCSPRGVLNWLDEHPDQVPGRTVTASERAKILDSASSGFRFGWDTGFHTAGGRVVPDPGPTNAEKLREILNEVWTPAQDARTFAEWLDSNGVKAPEADND